MAIPCIAVTLSICLSSARLYCDVNIEKYNEAPYHEKVATLAYWLCFTFFVYLCALADISFLYYINRSLAELDSTLSSNRSTSVGSGTGLSPGDYRKAQMSLFLNRLKCYPLIFVLGWIPDSLTLLWILVSGKAAIGIRCIANASAGSTGWAMAAAYFYYQFYAGEVGKSISSQLGSNVSNRYTTSGNNTTTQSPLACPSTSCPNDEPSGTDSFADFRSEGSEAVEEGESSVPDATPVAAMDRNAHLSIG